MKCRRVKEADAAIDGDTKRKLSTLLKSEIYAYIKLQAPFKGTKPSLLGVDK